MLRQFHDDVGVQFDRSRVGHLLEIEVPHDIEGLCGLRGPNPDVPGDEQIARERRVPTHCQIT